MTIDVKVTYKNDRLKTLRRAAGREGLKRGETANPFEVVQRPELHIVRSNHRSGRVGAFNGVRRENKK